MVLVGGGGREAALRMLLSEGGVSSVVNIAAGLDEAIRILESKEDIS